MKHYIFPVEKNGHRPKILEKKLVLQLGAGIFSLFTLAFLHTFYLPGQLNQTAAVISSVLVEKANEGRTDEGFGELKVNPLLEKSAQLKADHMAANSYFEHYAPDGTTPWEFFRQAGYKFTYAGENLAVNFSDSTAVARAWMNSPTHRDNIMSEKYTEIGIATAIGKYKGKDTIFVAQHFGSPLNRATSTEIIKEEKSEQLAASLGTLINSQNLFSEPRLLYVTIFTLIGMVIIVTLLATLLHTKAKLDKMQIIYGLSLLLIVSTSILILNLFANSKVLI